MFKNLSIPTRVEKDPLALVFHQRGVSPCFRRGWRLAKRVVQDRDAIVGLTSTQTRKQKERKHKTQRDTGPQVALRGGLCVRDYSRIFSGSQEKPSKPDYRKSLCGTCRTVGLDPAELPNWEGKSG